MKDFRALMTGMAVSGIWLWMLVLLARSGSMLALFSWIIFTGLAVVTIWMLSKREKKDG